MFLNHVNLRETLDELELGGNLAALVGDLLLGPDSRGQSAEQVFYMSKDLLLELGAVGTILEGDLRQGVSRRLYPLVGLYSGGVVFTYVDGRHVCFGSDSACGLKS